MYIHLGNDTAVPENEIIGIFDIENTSVNKDTKEFLSNAGKTGKTAYVSFDMPKAYVLCSEKVYITAVSSLTLNKRICRFCEERKKK